jgi:UDP-GlcNAc:undecaprenyl-phosphate GlcNAc-1-phosphate transferase
MARSIVLRQASTPHLPGDGSSGPGAAPAAALGPTSGVPGSLRWYTIPVTMDPLALVLVPAAAATGAGLLTPGAAWLARRLGVVDRPSARKVHPEPVPMLGGLAVAATVALAVAPRWPSGAAAVLVPMGAVAVLAAGLVDDWRGLGVGAKLCAQLAGAAVAVAGGLSFPLGGPHWLGAAAAVLWLVALTNATNLLDNMDGLAGGVTAIQAAAVAVLALGAGRDGVAWAALAVVGACAGFLIHNYPSASVFLGDAGSQFLGFTVAALALAARPVAAPWTVALALVLVFALPAADTSLVVVSRLRRGLDPLRTPGTDHLSHRLVARGRSSRGAVAVLWLSAALTAAAGVAVCRAPVTWTVIAGVGLVAGLGLVVWRFEAAGVGSDPGSGVPGR